MYAAADTEPPPAEGPPDVVRGHEDLCPEVRFDAPGAEVATGVAVVGQFAESRSVGLPTVLDTFPGVSIVLAVVFDRSF